MKELDLLRYKGNKTEFLKQYKEYCQRNRLSYETAHDVLVWDYMQSHPNPMYFDFSKAYAYASASGWNVQEEPFLHIVEILTTSLKALYDKAEYVTNTITEFEDIIYRIASAESGMAELLLREVNSASTGVKEYNRNPNNEIAELLSFIGCEINTYKASPSDANKAKHTMLHETHLLLLGLLIHNTVTSRSKDYFPEENPANSLTT